MRIYLKYLAILLLVLVVTLYAFLKTQNISITNHNDENSSNSNSNSNSNDNEDNQSRINRLSIPDLHDWLQLRKLLQLDNQTRAFFDRQFVKTFPRESFEPWEFGDCVNNGDARMKGLTPNCGCEPEPTVSSNVVHRCCRPHLLKLLKDVFSAVIQEDFPFILTDGGIIGWYRNGKLIPYDWDLDAYVPVELFHAPKFKEILRSLGVAGYCIWFRSRSWIKIWSSVIAFDVLGFRLEHGKVEVLSPESIPPYDVNLLLPRRLDRMEGYPVFIPNKPKEYLDQRYGEGIWEKPLNCTQVNDKKCYW